MTARPPLETAPPWLGRRIVLAVTGGIACYKAVTIARDLTRLGGEVDVLMSEAAGAFLKPLVFEGVTGRPVLSSLWSAEGAARHIRVAREADVVLVAPATADLMARAAHGRADDLITTVLLATRAPVILAPAMNDRMWDHARTALNATHLTDVLGYTLIGPAEGPLAVGEGDGPGRMVEPEELVAWVGRALGGRSSPWNGVRLLVTAGPTHEPLDPVRFVGNRSSGKMGFALAREGWLRGADVTLITGPSSLDAPVGVRTLRVGSAVEMRDATVREAPDHGVQVFAAAVSDFRPETTDDRKWKRAGGASEEPHAIRLTENPDVAIESRAHAPDGVLRIGFALETDDLLGEARRKLDEKGFDWIVANAAGEADAGFDAATNRGWMLDRAAPDEPDELPLSSKEAFARAILDRVEASLPGNHPVEPS